MAFVRSSKPIVALCVLATVGLGVLEASKRSAWIFELGTILVCSAAARQVGPLGTDCGKLDVGLGHRLTPTRRKTIVHRLRQIDAAIGNARGLLARLH